MARKRVNHKGRRESGSFVALPRVVLQHPWFAGLSAPATKLLIDLLAQFSGTNNGDLALAWKLMRPRGWKSRDTLNKARRELEAGGWIMRTRQGGKNRATLWAMSFYAIDSCNNKLDVKPTAIPSSAWKDAWEKSLARSACQVSTVCVLTPKARRRN